MTLLTPESVFRRYETAGVPDSGPHNPDKDEIIQLLNTLFGVSRGGWVVAKTLAELNSIVPPSANDGGVVLTGAGAGYYDRDAGAWVFGRPFPDTFAKVVLTGSGTAQTGVVSAGVNPAGVEVFYAKVATPNTGPLTLSISGGPVRQVVNIAGNPLSAGEWTGMVMFYLNDANQYQLVIDAGAAAAAAQSAINAGSSAASAQGYAAMLSADKIKFATVAQLWADTTMSYTAGPGLIQVAAGNMIEAGGIRFEVAAAGAANRHDVTAGGVRLYLRSAGKIHVLFATGQSNIENHPAFNWSPPPNLYHWNSSATQVGYTLVRMTTNEIRVVDAYAAEVARANPKDLVVVVNVGRGSTPLPNWLPSPPTFDMYAAGKGAVEACLSFLGLTTIDEMLWWQGESDWFANKAANYVANFQTLFGRLIAEAWFPRETPITIFAVSAQYTSDVTLKYFNAILKRVARIESQYRTFVDTTTLAGAYWEASGSYLHPNGPGVDVIGRMGYAASHQGKGADKTATPWQTLVKSANESRVSTTTLANDDELKFGLRSGRNYRIRGSLRFQSVVAADVKYGFDGPAAIVIDGKFTTRSGDSPSAHTVDVVFGAAYPTNRIIDNTTNQNSWVDFEIFIASASGDGMFALQWAQNTSNAGTTRLFAGSYIEVMEV